MAMDKNIKARWVAKLREPGRRQTKGKLRDAEGRQCCLDVLCEVAVEDGVIDPPIQEGEGQDYAYFLGEDEDGELLYEYGVLPNNVREWAGLVSYDPVLLDSDGTRRPASAWNDSWDKTFPEIADMIEADEEL
jgi:hypothetical protein